MICLIKKICLAALVFAAAGTSAAEKVLLCCDASLAQGGSAIFSGARDAAADFAKISNTNFEFDFSMKSGEGEFVEALEKAYLGGYYGAVIYPPRGAGKALLGKLAQLRRAGFPVAVLGRRFQAEDAVCRISTDSSAARGMLERALGRRGAAAKAACYFPSRRRASVDCDSGELGDYLPETISPEDFRAVFAGKILAAEAFDFYSTYAEENKIEIMRRDAFGEVFLSPSLLANMAPIKPDSDRKYAICVGGLPLLEYYLASGQITDCVYDDFYGWGVLAFRELFAARSGGARADKARVLQVKPIYVSAQNYAIFLADWRKWLK